MRVHDHFGVGDAVEDLAELAAHALDVILGLVRQLRALGIDTDGHDSSVTGRGDEALQDSGVWISVK